MLYNTNLFKTYNKKEEKMEETFIEFTCFILPDFLAIKNLNIPTS